MNHAATVDPIYREPLANSASRTLATTHAQDSAVSWAAIVAGAAGAAALSMCLLILGVGLGMSSISPWAQSGISAERLGVSTIVWVTATSLLASALGGYLAGRLRIRWTALHSDETYFRDTAHGFLTWALATLVTASLLASAIGAIVSGGVQAGATVAGGAATGLVAGATSAATTDSAGPIDYYVDSLFRPGAASTVDASQPLDGAQPINASPAPRSAEIDIAEARGILTHVTGAESLSPDDTRYLGQLIARRTGLTQQQAEARVAEVHARLQAARETAESEAKSAADKARKATAYGSLWLFIALLGGAFFASLAATFGGRQRDL